MRARLTLLGAVAVFVLALAAGSDAGTSKTPVHPRAHRRAAISRIEISRRQLSNLQRAAKRRATIRAHWLRSPAIRAQRTASRTAYRSLTPTKASALDAEKFASVLSGLGASPAASVAASGRVLGYRNNYTAIVREANGRRVVEQSTAPLRTAGGPIDLNLASHGVSYSPIRSAVAMSISRDLSSGATIGPGVRIVLEANPSRGTLGAHDTVFYPTVGTDLDASVTPTTDGLDMAAILRSPASPETLRYRVNLPHGLTLKAAGTGAAIYRGATLQLRILPPQATDAQATPVPVTLNVAANQLVLHIAHRSRDLAYPILVDPQITVPWTDPSWQFTNGYCPVDPPPGSFSGPQPGEVIASAGTYRPEQCGWWTWYTSSEGLGEATRLEFDDATYTADSSGNLYGSVGPAQGYAPDCTSDYPSPDNESWSGTYVFEGSDCGFGVWILIGASGPYPSFNAGPATLTVGAVLVTAPYLSAPSTPETFGGGSAGAPNLVHSCAGKPVDCGTGNLFETRTDLAFQGRGLPFAVTRTYNAQAAVAQSSPGLFGYGWASSFSDHLLVDSFAGTVTVVQANGSEVPFTGTTGTLTPEGGWVQATLVANSGGTYTYTLPDQETEQFDSSGRLVSEADRYGNTLTCAYDGSGNLASVTDAAGRSIAFTHNSDGAVSQATGPMGSVSYSYDTSGDLTQVTDLDGGVWHYAYDATHRLTSETDPLGNSTTNIYDSSDRVVSQTDGAGRTRTWSYGSNATTITNPGGDVTQEQFNHADEPTSITRGYGTSAATTETYAYDASYNLIYLKDGNGHQWAYTYDSAGNRTSATDPLGNETQWSYDADRDVTSTIDPLDHTTTYGYSSGELTSISRSLTETGQTQTTQYAYDAHGDVTGVTDPRSKQTTYGYDAAGDLTSITSPSSAETSWTYDGSGYPTAMTGAAGNAPGANPAQYTTTYQNNPFGQPTEITDPVGNVTKLSYDLDGNVASQTSAAGDRTTYSYDGDSELIAVRRSDGTTAKASYTDDAQISSQTDGAGDTSTYGYDPVGDQTSSTDALHRETDYSYDAAGNLATLTDPGGRITTYGYDTANELTSVSYSDGTTPNVGYVYNANGQRTSMSDGTGTTIYSYDSLGRVTDLTDGASQHVTYGYDLDNNITGITYPNSQSITQTYDDSERLASITDWLGNTTSFGYDTDSNLQRTTYPPATDDVDSYTYDHADQLTSTTMAQATTTLASMTYQPGPAGQLASTTETGLPEPATPSSNTYAYDAADRATELDNQPGYTYDAAGELTSSPAGRYSYDQLGDRTQLTPTTGTATQYDYDQASRLITYTPPTGSPTTYAYNGDGLRASKTTGTDTTSFAWDQSGPLPLLLSDGHSSYIYGPNDQPIEQISSANQVEYLHHDRLGSTRLMTDATGTTAGAYTYSPYGALTAHAGAATTPLQYAGQYTDPETGLQYDRARYYDPVTGQFPTQDPLEAITQQPYAYADADPINETDPLGLCGSLASWGGFWANCGSDVTSAAGRAITSASQQTEPGALLGLASTITGHSLGICAGGEAGIGHVISAGGCYIATPTGPCLTVTSGNTSGGALGVNASGLLGSEQKCGEFGGHFAASSGSAGSFTGSAAVGNGNCGPVWQITGGASLGAPIGAWWGTTNTSTFGGSLTAP